MAFGLILWVSYMALLLGARVAFSRYVWRVTLDNQNLDTGDSNSILFDEGDLANKLAGLLPPNYIQPSVEQPPSLIPAGQTPANTENGNGIEHIVNGAAREWDSNLFDPITFPLQQKMTFNQPQSAPIYTSKKFASPSLVEGSFENLNTAKTDSSPYVPASSPSFQSWQPASTVVDGYPSGSLNQQRYTVSSPGGDLSNSVFGRPSDNSEDPLSSGLNVFGFSSTPTKNGPKLEQVSNKYPSVAKPQRPAALNTDWYGQGNDISDGSAGYDFPLLKHSFQGPVGLPYYRDWMGFPFSSFGDDLYYGQMALQPQNFVTNTEKFWVPQMRLSQRAIKPSRPSRKNFVVHSKSGYQRRRFLQSKTTYIPGFEMPQKYTPEYTTPRKYRKSPTPFRGPAQNLIRRPVQDPMTSRKI